MSNITYINIDKEIHKILKSEPVGATQQTLAEKLGVSRPTISKYLQILLDKGLVVEEQIGGIKFWTCVKDSNPQSVMVYKKLVNHLLNELIREYQEYVIPNINYKEIGKNISESLEKISFFDSENIFKIVQKSNILLDFSIEKLAKVIHEILGFFNNILDVAEIESPTVLKNPPIIMIRVKDSSIMREPQLIDIIIGMFEFRAGQILGKNAYNVEYIQNKEERFIDFIIKL